MSFRARLSLGWIALLVVPEAVAILLLPQAAFPVAAAWLVLLCASLERPGRDPVRFVLARAAARQMEEAVEREDLDLARRRLGEVATILDGSTAPPALEVMTEAGLLMVEERYEEGLALLECIDRAGLPERFRPHLDNSTAWALAHLGKREQSLEHAGRALDAAEGSLVSAALGTLATALFLAERHAEAADTFERALADRSYRCRAVTLFYFGETLTALGRLEAARGLFQSAAAHPNRWGARARARLAEHQAPYR